MKAASEASAAHAFDLIWVTLTGVLGTAATATMFRRAVKNAARKHPDRLHGLAIVRDGMDYRYVLPEAWRTETPECVDAIRYLVRHELCPLLEELTGPVVIRLLERHPELQRYRIVSGQE